MLPRFVGIGQHIEECRARIEHEMVDQGDATKIETRGNQKEMVKELDVSLKKWKLVSQISTHARCVKINGSHTQKERIWGWTQCEKQEFVGGVDCGSQYNFCVTCHLCASVTIALHKVENSRKVNWKMVDSLSSGTCWIWIRSSWRKKWQRNTRLRHGLGRWVAR